MKIFHFLLVAFALSTILVVAKPVSACPACQDAVINGSGKDDDDPMREARAYNQSIYLMVAVPYGTLGTFGLLIYRGHRSAFKKALAEQQSGISAGL